MSPRTAGLAAAFVLTALVGAGGGWFAAMRQPPSAPDAHAGAQPDAGTANDRPVLYWFDPMYPSQRFEAPGKSPFMDMQLVPKYADDADDNAGTVRIDPTVAQNLGMRTAAVTRGALPARIDAVGTLAFNGRDVAVVQARADGFVERVYDLAADDVVAARAPLVDLLVPSWVGAEIELLALRAHGDAALLAAARERLALLGAPPDLIARVEARGKTEGRVTVTTPIAGVIQSLEVRAGMSVRAGETLARINGLDPVWLDVAVPERAIGRLRLGDSITASLRAFPGESFTGKVIAIVPETRSETRTVTVRTALTNAGGRLRPGMFAEVEIDTGDPAPALLVPSEAVIRTGRRTLVFLAEGDGRYRPRAIETGRQSDGLTVVLAGLEGGDEVVVSGQFLVDSEASLSAVLAPGESTTSTHEAMTGHGDTGMDGPHDMDAHQGMKMEGHEGMGPARPAPTGSEAAVPTP